MTGEEPMFKVEEVESVAPPPRARVDGESAAEKLERKRDYLEGFLAEKPQGVPAGEPGGNLYEAVIDALKEIFDPEIPVNIYELGLIYGVDITDEGSVAVTMTLTTPHARSPNQCPPRSKCGSARCPACAMPRSVWCGIRRGTWPR